MKYSWNSHDNIRDTLMRFLDPEFQKDWCDGVEERAHLDGGEHILDAIQYFLSGSFLLNSNPLPNLRRVFPDVLWKFYEFDVDGPDTPYIAAMSAADIFWPAYPDAAEIYWVTARLKKSNKHPMVVCGCLDVDFGSDWGIGPIRDLILGGKGRVPRD